MTGAIEILPETREFLSAVHGLMIGGKNVPASSGESFDTIDPATGKRLATVASGGAADIDSAVGEAQKAGSAWGKILPAERERILHRFADQLEQNAELLAQVETLDNGKPYEAARNVEVNVAISQLRYYAGWPTKLGGEIYPVSSPEFLVYSRRDPLGVCGAITPWNYSLLMAVQKIGPALACGNTLVVKPAEQTPLTALLLGKLALEAGIPAGVLNVVTGFGHTAGRALAEHPGVAKIGFTGSTEVGRDIMRMGAGNLKRITLELGGKSPLIIFDDANVEAATEAAFWGLFGNSGQNCVASSRLYLHETIADRALESLTEMAAKTVVGPGMNDGTQIGPLISQTQMDRVLGFIERGQADGARLVHGGNRLDGNLADGYFLQPTIFSDTADTASIGCEEIFGPVLTVYRFSSESEVVQRANALPYGLAAGVWTRDINRGHRVAAMLKAGVVWVNTYNWFDPSVPFGGTGQSGYGKEMGRDVMELYTEKKSIWVRVENLPRVSA